MTHKFKFFQIINSDLEQPTKDLASLTVVVKAVRQVTSQHAHLHTAILDVRQMFHTLSVYGIEVARSCYRGRRGLMERKKEGGIRWMMEGNCGCLHMVKLPKMILYSILQVTDMLF